MSITTLELWNDLLSPSKEEVEDVKLHVYDGIQTMQYTALPNYWSQSPYVDDLTLLPLAEVIRRSVKENRGVFIPVCGAKGLGKSTLAGWLAYSYYGDWEKVKEHFVFTLDQLLYLIQTRDMIPLVVWDDMAVHFGKWTMTNKKLPKTFFEYFQGIRVKVRCLIGTMVRLSSPPKALREDYFGEVMMTKRGVAVYNSYRKGVDFKHAGEESTWKSFVEYIYVKGPLPDEFRVWYEEQRLKLLEMKYQRLLDVLAEENRVFLQNLTGVESALFMDLLTDGYIDETTLERYRITNSDVDSAINRFLAYGVMIQKGRKYEATDFARKLGALLLEGQRKRGRKRKEGDNES